MTLNGEIFGLPIPDAGPIFATALVLHILSGLTAVIAGALAATARQQPGWPPHHAIGMGGSYIALLTGFYVDNGPFLPLWDRLPHILYWVLPSLSASRSSGLRYDASRTGQPRIPIRSHMGTDHPMIAV
jgi:hypothetical protein